MSFDSFEFWENKHNDIATSRGKPCYEYSGKEWEKGIKLRADKINKFIDDHNIKKVLDYGCGNGIHSHKIIVDNYLGIEISKTAIQKCKALNPEKIFYLAKKHDEKLKKLIKDFKPDLSLSFWVISHLIEDEFFKEYMGNLFFAKKFVIIHETDIDKYLADYQKQREFTKYISKNFTKWELIIHDELEYFYQRC